MMKNSDIPMAPSRGQSSSSRQKLKQKLDRTPGMLLLQAEEQAPEPVVHRTSSATRNFSVAGTISGFRRLASRGPRSWLVRDTSLPANMNLLETESNASSYGSVSAFGSRFGSTVDLAGLIGLEDLAVVGTPCEEGLQHTHSIIQRSQMESVFQRHHVDDEFHTPRHDIGNTSSDHGNDETLTEQFMLDGLTEDQTGLVNQQTNAIAIVGDVDVSMQEGAKHLQHERAAIIIQSVFRASRDRNVVKSKLAAVITIQRFYRGFRARCTYRQFQKEVVKLQAWTRTVKARRQYRKLYNTVVMLQKLWTLAKRRQLVTSVTKFQSLYRGWVARKAYKQLVAATVLLQARVRGVQARKRYHHLHSTAVFLQRTRRSLTLQRMSLQQAEAEKSIRIALQEQECAAMKIQAVYRRWVARKAYVKLVLRVVWLQACVRRNQMLKQYQRHRQAALCIQRMWLGHRKKLGFQSANREYSAAVSVQRAYRGWVARRTYIKEMSRVILLQSCVRRSQAVSKYQKLLGSVVKVQTAWRAYRCRQLQLWTKERDQAAIKIQCHYRGYVARNQYHTQLNRVVKLQACVRRRQAVNLYRKRLAAAVTIQKAWKMHHLLCQQQVQQDEEACQRAALQIQSAFRVSLSRKRRKSVVDRVVKLQALVRRQIAQKTYRRIRKAVVSIQRSWRTSRNKKLQRQAAVTIQTHYRGWSARNKFDLEYRRVVLLQACARRMIAQYHYQALYNAVCTIQRSWRAVTSRRRHLRWELESAAALKIQSVYRGWVSRKSYDMNVDRVLYIQACFRRYQARTQYQELRCTIVKLQRHRRKVKDPQVELQNCAAVRIQSWWRGHCQQMLFKSVLQLRVESSVRIQRWWRGTRALQSLKLNRWLKEQAVRCIQAHFRGRMVRKELQGSHCAVLPMQSADQSFVCRKAQREGTCIDQSCNASEVEEVDVVSQLTGDQISDGRQPKTEDMYGPWNTTSTRNPAISGSFNVTRLSSYTEPESSSYCGDSVTERYASPSAEDWNSVQIEELDKCLDTCLAALPLRSMSSRQLSVSFGVDSQSSSIADLDTASSAGLVDTPGTESSEGLQGGSVAPNCQCNHSQELCTLKVLLLKKILLYLMTWTVVI